MSDNKSKLLIVEDDSNLQLIYKKQFESHDFVVTVASAGQQGLTLAHDTKPDVILLDIMLPSGMNGFDFLQQIKQSQTTKDIPVVIITNLDSEKETGLQMGASDYVIKAETSIDDLVGKVKKQLKKGKE